MNDMHVSDTQNFVSMNQSNKQGDQGNTVKFIAVLMAIELNKETSNGDAIFTTKMKLEMYKAAFKESKGRNSEKLNEDYETEIDKLQCELDEEKIATNMVIENQRTERSIRDANTVRQEADTVNRQELLEPTKAALIYSEGSQKELDILQITEAAPLVSIIQPGKHSTYIKKTLMGHSEPWNYYFESMTDLDMFVDCLNSHFTGELPANLIGSIKLNKKSKTKFAKALHPIYWKLTSNPPLNKDVSFCNAIRVLDEFKNIEPMQLSRMM